MRRDDIYFITSYIKTWGFILIEFMAIVGLAVLLGIATPNFWSIFSTAILLLIVFVSVMIAWYESKRTVRLFKRIK